MTDFKRVFIDTSPIIYYLENNTLYKDGIKNFFAKCFRESIQIVTSVVRVEEYLVFPYSSGKVEFADNFKRFIKLWMSRLSVSATNNIILGREERDENNCHKWNYIFGVAGRK